MTAALEDLLQQGLEALAVPASAAQREQLLTYVKLLQHWNRRINLTAITDGAQIVIRHLLDSAALVPLLQSGRLLDVGSGGGLPGLVVAVLRPDIQVVSVESRHKKVAFQRQAARELALDNFEAHCIRIEDLPTEDKFAQITSRAFAALGDFCALVRPLISPEGRVLAMKGQLSTVEAEAVVSGWEVVKIHRLSVPGLDEARHVVELTPAQSEVVHRE